MPCIVIVGAGISGLAIAYRLQQLAPRIDIVLLEQGDRPGGTLWTRNRDGFQVETGANGFLDTKPTTLNLCTELGLADRLLSASEAASKNRYLYLNGRLRILPGSFGGLLKTDLLSWRGKLSFLWERFRGRRRQAGDESIAAFAARRAGKETAEVFADAMVTGIYAGDPALLSLPACFPRIAALEREYGSILKGLGKTARQRRLEAAQRGEAYRRPGMWSLRDGLRLLVEALRDRLKMPPICGVQVRCDGKAWGCWSESGALFPPHEPHSPAVPWMVHGAGQESWPCRCRGPGLSRSRSGRTCWPGSTPTWPAASPRFPTIGWRSSPSAIAGRIFPCPSTASVTSPRNEHAAICWECSGARRSFRAGRRKGAVLLRAMCGGWHRAEMLDWDDDRLLQSARAELQQTMGISAAPFFQDIIRWDRAIPQYHLGHLERVAWLDERVQAASRPVPGRQCLSRRVAQRLHGTGGRGGEESECIH